jgi:hypothetical protein
VEQDEPSDDDDERAPHQEVVRTQVADVEDRENSGTRNPWL